LIFTAFEIGFEFFHVLLRIRDFSRAHKERDKLQLDETDDSNGNGDHGGEGVVGTEPPQRGKSRRTQVFPTSPGSEHVRKQLDRMSPIQFEKLASKVCPGAQYFHRQS
jgi:hypothetical protein